MGCSSSTVALEEGEMRTAILEALRHAATLAVKQASAAGGFAKNAKIRIEAPPQLEKVFAALSKIPGAKDKVDEFLETMNAAAEAAAAEALGILRKAVDGLSLTQVRDIVFGEDNAATRFFEDATRAQLLTTFQPICAEKVGSLGAAKLLDAVFALYNKLPFNSAPAFNLDEYVANKALDGLFVLLAEKEAAVRTIPTARQGLPPVVEHVFNHPTVVGAKRGRGAAANAPM